MTLDSCKGLPNRTIGRQFPTLSVFHLVDRFIRARDPEFGTISMRPRLEAHSDGGTQRAISTRQRPDDRPRYRDTHNPHGHVYSRLAGEQ